MAIQLASFPIPHVVDVRLLEDVTFTLTAADDDDEETAPKEVTAKRLRVSTIKTFIIKFYFIYLLLANDKFIP